MPVLRRLLLMVREVIIPPTPGHILTIQGVNSIESTNVQYSAIYDNSPVSSGMTWSIISGSQYASIDNSGEVTILSGANNSTVIIQVSYLGMTATKTISLTYKSGTTSQTETTTTTDPETGELTTKTTTTTTNQDGSSITTTTTVTTDENGDVTGSSETETNVAVDGSSSTTTTNYDENGDPTSGTNNTIDTLGNSNTQEVVYDENGNTTVTSYIIDTTGNEQGTGETITGTGVNTEFIPFDGTSGFEMHIRFYSRKQDQPNPPIVTDTEDTSSNYHFTILCAKDPRSPYPGFHIRWTLSRTNYNSGNLVLGYRGRTGSAKNQSLALSKNNDMYDFTITYDPELKKYPSKFRCVDNLNGGALVTLNLDFNAINYECTLGYNINQQGQPYRYSNLTIYEFSINKL